MVSTFKDCIHMFSFVVFFRLYLIFRNSMMKNKSTSEYLLYIEKCRIIYVLNDYQAKENL